MQLGSDTAAAAVVAATPGSSAPPISPSLQFSGRPRPDHSLGEPRDDIHVGRLIASLWEHAPFPRVPADAPAELDEFVSELENPKRVYAIHRAVRRHDCQDLVGKFIAQLRYGCGTKTCATPTCFSYRKLLARDAPIRRYNTTSARTLAVYMAGIDNPKAALCPNLRIPKGPPASTNSLILRARRPNPSHDPSQGQTLGLKSHILDIRPPSSGAVEDGTGCNLRQQGSGPAPSAHVSLAPSPQSLLAKPLQQVERPDPAPKTATLVDSSSEEPTFEMEAAPVRKDPRSFVANVFGTVAFKMMEWLSPASVEYMYNKATEATDETSPRDPQPRPTCKASRRKRPATKATSTAQPALSSSEGNKTNGEAEISATIAATDPTSNAEGSSREKNHAAPRAGPSRRNSSATVRTPPGQKARRRLSLEPFPPPVDETNGMSPKTALASPKMNSVSSSEKARLQQRSGKKSGRLVSEPLTFEVSEQEAQQPSPGPTSPDTVLDSDKADNAAADETRPGQVPKASSRRPTKTPSRRKPVPTTTQRNDETQNHDSKLDSDVDDRIEHSVALPQTISHLSIDLIDFFGNVMDEDGTGEGPLFEEDEPEPELVLRKQAQMKRTKRSGWVAAARKAQWKLFIEQALFSALSEPRALIRSFSQGDGMLLDATMIWYGLLRLTRTAPSLVLDSLWLASSRLFSPPPCLQAPRPSSSRSRRHNTIQPLSNAEAAQLMAVCLHALVAVVPIIRGADDASSWSSMVTGQIHDDPRKHQHNYDMQCLDVYSNELALRLAKRLFTSLAARHYYAELVDNDDDVQDTAADLDLLQPFFDHIGNADPSMWLLPSDTLRMPFDSIMTSVLLEWARCVMMNEWDGQPMFASDGCFGGAMLFMTALHKARECLYVGERRFEMPYFSSRLDPAAMPMAWLSFVPTQRRKHLLDYPFLFSHDARVTYFRVINLSRMTEHYMMSRNYFTRCVELDESNLIFTTRYRDVVRDLVKNATSSYLVLEISRENLVEDAFDQLWRREHRELLRPLKVLLGQHEGEEGADLGGVQQEFFRLIIAQCLDPKYGAFTLDEKTRMLWFVPNSVVELWKYEMIGLLFSLALYNGLTLPVTFPKALYRKLLHQPVCEIDDISDGWRDLASGLSTLLEWDEEEGLVEDVFARTYEFSFEAFGQVISRDMRSRKFETWPVIPDDDYNNASNKGTANTAGSASDENPTDAPLVTSANREAYVSDYIRWLTDVSVAPQFAAFERGFNTCIHPKSLTLLDATLLGGLVEGVQKIDVAQLRRHTQLVSWSATDRSPQFFWEVVAEFDDGMMRKLLEFVTASDRVPVGGVAGLRLVVQKNGEYKSGEQPRLPTAYTCYSILLLPEYECKEVLRERLTTALQNAQGFGFA